MGQYENSRVITSKHVCSVRVVCVCVWSVSQGGLILMSVCGLYVRWSDINVCVCVWSVSQGGLILMSVSVSVCGLYHRVV